MISKKNCMIVRKSYRYYIRYDDYDTIRPILIELKWLGFIKSLNGMSKECLLRLPIKYCLKVY